MLSNECLFALIENRKLPSCTAHRRVASGWDIDFNTGDSLLKGEKPMYGIRMFQSRSVHLRLAKVLTWDCKEVVTKLLLLVTAQNKPLTFELTKMHLRNT